MPDGVITVVLADDNLIVRTGVRALLAREADVQVVGEAADHPELLAAAEHQPQVVVCLLYTSDAADDGESVDLGGRRII